MIRDRGLTKWQGFMMPEHIKKLKEYEREEEKVIRPILDEQKVEELNELILESMELNLTLIFTLFNGYLGRFNTIKGKVHYIDTHNNQLRIIDDNEEIHRLFFKELVDIQKD